jgi:uncharacterized cupin superfamily protein
VSDAPRPLITHVASAPEETQLEGEHWGSSWRVLTEGMRERGGRLGVVLNRLPPGRAGCPLHAHQREDEVFYVLEGEGLLRYGDGVYPLRAGDCVSCPAGSGIAHQIANASDRDLVYLAIGDRDPHEVCTYPESGKVYVRSLSLVGTIERKAYMDGEPEEPAIFTLPRAPGPAGER